MLHQTKFAGNKVQPHLLFLPFLGLIALSWLIAGLSAKASAQSANLLQNPGFEGEYIPYANDTRRLLAPGWSPWNISRRAADRSFINLIPEYRAATNQKRILSGSRSQEYFTLFATHTGGVFQRVQVTTGSRLRFSAFVNVWSTSRDDANASEQPGRVRVRVGIDPTGGVDGGSPAIVWSQPQEFYDQYKELSVEANSGSNFVTVFVESAPKDPVKINNVYVDDASLVVTGQGQVPTTAVPVVTTTVELGLWPTPNQFIPTREGTIVAGPSPTLAAVTLVPLTPRAIPGFPDLPGRIVYIVVAGDTVGGIAQRFSSRVDAIIAANRLPASGLIRIGQRLIIPVPGAVASPMPLTLASTKIVLDTPTETLAIAPTVTYTRTMTRTPALTSTPRIIIITATNIPITSTTISKASTSTPNDLATIQVIVHATDTAIAATLSTRTPTGIATPTTTPTQTVNATFIAQATATAKSFDADATKNSQTATAATAIPVTVVAQGFSIVDRAGNVIGSGQVRLYAPESMSLTDKSSIIVEIEADVPQSALVSTLNPQPSATPVLWTPQPPPSPLPLVDKQYIEVHEWMGAGLRGIHRDQFNVEAIPPNGLVRMLPRAVNWWKWDISPKGEGAIGIRHLEVYIYLPSQLSDGTPYNQETNRLPFLIEVKATPIEQFFNTTIGKVSALAGAIVALGGAVGVLYAGYRFIRGTRKKTEGEKTTVKEGKTQPE